jgi:hypothetical protein
MRETWRPVVGYEGSYEVSDLGRVRSVDRLVEFIGCRGGRGVKSLSGVTLSQKMDRSGRMNVNLSVENETSMKLVHRLVLEAFVGPCPDGMEACHWDGNPGNNRPGNLRWDTHKNNHLDKIRHGRSGRGELRSTARLTNWEAAWIKRFARHGFATRSYLAEMFKVPETSINSIVYGKSWTWMEV